MRTTTALLSTLALLLLAAPAAIASPCENGTRINADGTVRNIVPTAIGTMLYVEFPSLDCNNVLLLTKDGSTCQAGSSIHASGTLSEHHDPEAYMGWSLSDAPAQTGPGFSASFACK